MQLQQSLATAIAAAVTENTATGVGSHGRRKHRHRRQLPQASAYPRWALKCMKVMHCTKDIDAAIKIIKDKKKKLQAEEDTLQEKRRYRLMRLGYRLMHLGCSRTRARLKKD